MLSTRKIPKTRFVQRKKERKNDKEGKNCLFVSKVTFAVTLIVFDWREQGNFVIWERLMTFPSFRSEMKTSIAFLIMSVESIEMIR